MSLAAEVHRAARETHRSPTPAQAESGNYRKGRVVLHGLPIRIETPRGATRRGIGADGKPWSVRMKCHYGYFERTSGADGDEVDCYIGPNPEATDVFVIDQVDANTGKYDEHKCMLGFSGPGAARRCYIAGFSDGKGAARLGKMTKFTLAEFKQALESGRFKKPINRRRGGRVEARGSRADENAALSDLAERQGPMHESEQSLLPQLRRSRDHAASAMGGELSSLSRSHGAAADSKTHPGAHRERQGVRAGERAMGDAARAGPQHAKEHPTDFSWTNASSRRMGEGNGVGSIDAVVSTVHGKDVGGGGTLHAATRRTSAEHLRGYQSGGAVTAADPDRMAATAGVRRMIDESGYLPEGPTEPGVRIEDRRSPLYSRAPYQQEARRRGLTDLIGRVGYQEGGDVEDAPPQRPYIEITPHDRPVERDDIPPDVLGSTPNRVQTPMGNVPEQQRQTIEGIPHALGEVTGVNDALKAARGEMTPEEQEDFAIKNAWGALIPGGKIAAGLLGGVAKIAPQATRTLGKVFASPFGEHPLERALTVNDILHPETPTVHAPNSRNVTEIARDLEARGVAAHGKMGIQEPIEESAPHTDELIARSIASEVKAALERGGTTARDWYTHSIEEAMAKASLLHPEIGTDENARSAFAAALAITSQGEAVPSNVRLAEKAYSYFKQNGVFPTDVAAKKAPSINGNFTRLNDLLDRFDGDYGKVREFLHRDFTVRELEGELGGGVKIGGESKGTNVKGSQIFGSKIGGGFYQNLMGNYDPVTMDMWFMRGWGRLTGTLVGLPEEAIAKQQARLADALRDAGRSVPRSPEKLRQVADEIVAQHEKDFKVNRAAYDAGAKKKQELTYAAERFVFGQDGLNESPSSGSQREWIRSVVNRAREHLAKSGINVTNADLQAIWWYPEKELYAKLGGRSSEGLNVDYSTAIGNLVRSRGVSDEAITKALRSTSGRPRPAAAASDRGGAGSVEGREAAAPETRASGGRVGYAEGGSPGLSDADVGIGGSAGGLSDADVGIGGGAQPQYKPVKDERWWGTGFKDEKTGDPLVQEQAVGKHLGSVSRVYDSGPVFNDPSGNEVHVDPRKHVMRYEGGQRNVYERGPDTYRPWTWSDMGLLQSLWGGLTAGPDIVAGNVAPEDVYKRAGETAMLAMPGGAPVAGRVARVPGPSGERFIARDPGVSPTGGMNPADLARAEEAAGATARRTGAVRGAEDLENEFGFKYSQGQRTGDVNLQEYEDQAANGAFGPVAQKYAIDRIRAREASLRAAGQDVGQRLGEAETHGFFETPQEAGQQIVGDVSERARASRLAAARAEEEATQAANAQRQIIEDQRTALADIVGQGRQPGTLRDVGEAVGEEVRGASRAARTARSQLYQDVAAQPGEFEPGAFPALGRRIANELENRTDPIFVDENTPLSRSSLETLNNSEHLGIQQRATTPQERAAAREAGREIPDTVNEYVPTDLRRVDQARKLLVRSYSRAQQAARASGYYADVNAMREIMRSFDQHVEDALANGLFSGDPAALDAMRAARAAHADYARTYWSRDDVGTALRKIIDRNATPEEIGTMILGSANLRSGLPVRLADRLEGIFGRNSETWGDIRNAIWQRSSQVRNARGEIDPVRTAQSILDLSNSSLGRAVYEPEVLAAMRRHAGGVRDLADVIESLPETLQARAARTAHEDMFGGEGIGGAQQAIFRRIVSGEATPQEAASAIRSAIGSKNPGNVIRLINAIERITGPDSTTMAAIRQDVWNAMTKAAEQSRQPGARKVSEAIAKFMDGDIARRIYTDTERNIGLRYAEAVRRTEVPDFASNPSRSASKVLGGMRRLVGDMASHLATSAGAAVGAFAGPLGSAVGAAIGRVIEGTRASIGDTAQGRKFLRSQEGLPLEEPTITSPRRRLSPAEQIMRQIGAGQGYLISGAASRKLIGYSPTPQMPSVVPAEEKKKKVPRPPAQQKYGGEVSEPHRARGGRIGLSHEAVGYTKTSPHKDKRCGLCSMFRTAPRVHCTDVRDPIRALGYCDIFDRKKR